MIGTSFTIATLNKVAIKIEIAHVNILLKYSLLIFLFSSNVTNIAVAINTGIVP